MRVSRARARERRKPLPLRPPAASLAAPAAVQGDAWLVQTIVGLVAARSGVALVPEPAEALGRRGVAYRPIDAGAGRIELLAVWRRGDSRPVPRAFVDALHPVTRNARR